MERFVRALRAIKRLLVRLLLPLVVAFLVVLIAGNSTWVTFRVPWIGERLGSPIRWVTYQTPLWLLAGGWLVGVLFALTTVRFALRARGRQRRLRQAEARSSQPAATALLPGYAHQAAGPDYGIAPSELGADRRVPPPEPAPHE